MNFLQSGQVLKQNSVLIRGCDFFQNFPQVIFQSWKEFHFMLNFLFFFLNSREFIDNVFDYLTECFVGISVFRQESHSKIIWFQRELQKFALG